MTDHPRGYDVAQYQRDLLANVKKLVDDVALRKWCIEQSIALGHAGLTTPSYMQIYTFVTANLEAQAHAAPSDHRPDRIRDEPQGDPL